MTPLPVNRESHQHLHVTTEQRIVDAVEPSTAVVGPTRVAWDLSSLATLLAIEVHPLVNEVFPGGVSTVLWPFKSASETYQEQAAIWVPIGYDPYGPPCPLVVVVNQVGAAYDAVPQALIDAAMARGCILVGIKILTLTTFPGPISSLSVAAVKRYMVANYNVDKTRIYGIGASRGGGVIGRHAAAYRAAYDLPFAAIDIISAELERRQWWSKLPPATSTGLAGANDNNFQHRAQNERPDNMNGRWDRSRKAEHRFRWSNCLFFTPGSYAEYPSTAGGGTTEVARSIGQTLSMIPVRLNYDTADIIATLPHQNDELYDLLVAAGGTVVRNRTTNANTDPIVNNHAFGIIGSGAQDSYATILDWLLQYRVTHYPAAFKVVHGDDVPFAWVTPTRSDREDTGRFEVATIVTPGAEEITFTNVTREKVLDIDVGRSPFANFVFGAGTPLRIQSNAGVVLRLRNLQHAPAAAAGTGVMAGGANVGYLVGVFGANSIEVYPSGAGAMDVDVT